MQEHEICRKFASERIFVCQTQSLQMLRLSQSWCLAYSDGVGVQLSSVLKQNAILKMLLLSSTGQNFILKSKIVDR